MPDSLGRSRISAAHRPDVDLSLEAADAALPAALG
jgi:hypothetical protein